MLMLFFRFGSPGARVLLSVSWAHKPLALEPYWTPHSGATVFIQSATLNYGDSLFPMVFCPVDLETIGQKSWHSGWPGVSL